MGRVRTAVNLGRAVSSQPGTTSAGPPRLAFTLFLQPIWLIYGSIWMREGSKGVWRRHRMSRHAVAGLGGNGSSGAPSRLQSRMVEFTCSFSWPPMAGAGPSQLGHHVFRDPDQHDLIQLSGLRNEGLAHPPLARQGVPCTVDVQTGCQDIHRRSELGDHWYAAGGGVWDLDHGVVSVRRGPRHLQGPRHLGRRRASRSCSVPSSQGPCPLLLHDFLIPRFLQTTS